MFLPLLAPEWTLGQCRRPISDFWIQVAAASIDCCSYSMQQRCGSLSQLVLRNAAACMIFGEAVSGPPASLSHFVFHLCARFHAVQASGGMDVGANSTGDASGTAPTSSNSSDVRQRALGLLNMSVAECTPGAFVRLRPRLK